MKETMEIKEDVKPGYKKTKLGWIPIDWKIKPLKQCLSENPTYGINAAAVNYDTNLPTYIRITDIDDNGLYNPSEKVSVQEANWENFVLKIGDLVFARTGNTTGKSYLYNVSDGLLVYAGFLIKVHTDESKLLSEYLFLFTQTHRYWYWVKFMSARSGQPGINAQEYGVLEIPIPPIPEQRRIATILSTWDKAIETLQNLIAKKQERKKGLMQVLLTGRLRFEKYTESSNLIKTKFGIFPKDWKVVKLGEIGEFKNGINKGKEDFGFGYPFINLMDVFGKPKLIEADFGLVNATKNEVENYDLKKDDVLFIRSSVKPSGVGLTSTVQRDLTNTVYSGFLIRFRENKDLLTGDFKVYCFFANYFRNNLIKKSSVSANTNINQQSLAKLIIAIPGRQEQQKIASVLSAADAEIENLEKQLDKLQEQKKGLMQKLLTGEVRVKI